MMNFDLPNDLFDYLINILDIGSVKDQLLRSYSRQFTCTYFRLDLDEYLDLLEYLEDKQIEIGFDNWGSDKVDINKDGRILELIRDSLFAQKNR